ncbi:hypothetical protein FA95DRAFT_1559083 [Auriscalpium vulgare]|uniref:Uncharacterized protein n=2 Tax=Auriscalpium vulgare TaxID=40419 RepID=A0ACB8R3K1_9AGAM|nr:hypothetical protein FA95DRAFT_1567588 [Auriscalpium vulgare]KAI0047455.1 hypothetical protein FA95DRAFT_1559083 [Auriscalpium vulgare]
MARPAPCFNSARSERVLDDQARFRQLGRQARRWRFSSPLLILLCSRSHAPLHLRIVGEL